MTKSFTAAAVLALRDDGALALDDPAQEYVPELAGLPPATADSPAVSIRQLLTMTAGFPTDDPWGDRQQGTPLAEFAEFLAGGISFAWAPGTRFEYSNLGYAILGRVITAVSGREYPDFVTDRLLRPLGLSRTGYEAAEFSTAELARGYRHGEAGWSEQEPAPAGRSPRWAGSSAASATWPAGYTVSRPRSRPAPRLLGARTRCAAPPAARCSCRRSRWSATSRSGCPAEPRAARSATVSGFSPKPAGTDGSCTMRAVIRASAATCAGTRPPGPA